MDNRELLYRFPACDIFYNSDLQAVETQWKGPDASGDSLHKILDMLIQAMKDKHTGVVIADARQMHAILQDDIGWISQDWYPRAVSAGFRFEALVVTDYTFNAVTIRKIVRTYDNQKLKTAYFKTVPGAYEWVKQGCPD